MKVLSMNFKGFREGSEAYFSPWTAQEVRFSIEDVQGLLLTPADLATFTEEILNERETSSLISLPLESL